jgi:hypothetical protein
VQNPRVSTVEAAMLAVAARSGARIAAPTIFTWDSTQRCLVPTCLNAKFAGSRVPRCARPLVVAVLQGIKDRGGGQPRYFRFPLSGLERKISRSR